MTELSFDVLDITPDKYAAAPILSARLRIAELTGETVHMVALRVQIKIDAHVRRYDLPEQARLAAQFGEPERWSETLRPFTWTHATAMVPGFTGTTEFELPIACTYDTEVLGSRYFEALDGGKVPLEFLFSGTVVGKGETGFSVSQVPWHKAAPYQLPVAVWRELMDTYYANAGWLRLHRDTINDLVAYKGKRAIPNWDDFMAELLIHATGKRSVVSLFDVFAPAQAIADAVLYEGYVLYPYRASSDKNRIRWQWGVVGPAGARDDGVGEESSMATDLVAERWGATSVHLRLRFLQVVNQQVERLGADGSVGMRVESVVIGDQTHVSFDDSVERTVDAIVALGDGAVVTNTSFSFDTETTYDDLGSEDGIRYRLARRLEQVAGELRVRTEPGVEATSVSDAQVVHVEIVNTTQWEAGGTRDDANLRSMVGAHVLGAIHGGLFISTLDPPEEHAAVVQQCRAHRLWPVVVGAQRRASLALASPVILYDQPEIAPESNATFFDGLEIDEMLTLRVMTMTDEEKAEARATDPRSAAIIDRVDAMDADEMAALHGTIRMPDGRPGDGVPTIVGDGTMAEAADDLTGGKPWWDPGVDERFDPDTDGVVVAGEAISRGSVVRLHPGKRADAHDIFFRDRIATVRAVLHDVDGSIHVAVTIDDDPAADLNDETGRYLYFAPEEIEPLRKRIDS